MKKRVAINGLGRIGKLVFQYLLEEGKDQVEVVAINDLTAPSQLAYLLKYDSTQYPMGRNHEISYTTNSLIVDGKEYPVYDKPNPEFLPWKELKVDIVCECTGRFATPEDAYKHIKAGAKKVMVNSPVKGVKNIVFNVNSDTLDGTENIICGASCTTNCLAPIVDVLNKTCGVKVSMMDTIHAYTADQTLLDTPHRKGENSRRGRCAGMNIVPATTGAAEAVAKAIPDVKGRLTGMAFRVPTATGSVVSYTFMPINLVKDAEELNNILKSAVSETLGFTMDPVVSRDIVGISVGSLIDGQSTKVLTTDFGDQLCKIVAWYDNEASYTHQYVKTLLYWSQLF